MAAESLLSFSGSQHSACVVTTPCCRNEGVLQASPGFPQTLPCEPFIFADFALYPFAAINLSPEHDYMLSPVYLLANY